MAQSSAAATATASHHKRKRARHQSSGRAGGSTMRSTVNDKPTVEMREAVNRDGEMGRILLERGYLGAKLYTGPDLTTGLLPGQHDQILAEMKWVHADVVGLRDLKQAQCRRIASAVKEYWRLRTHQQERGGGKHVRLDKMPNGTATSQRHQLQATGALTEDPIEDDGDDGDTTMMDHGGDGVSSDEGSQYSNAAEARASIDPLRDIIDRLNDASAVWMSDKGPPIQSTWATSSSTSSSTATPRPPTLVGDADDDDAVVCSTVFVPGVVDFPDPGAEPRLRMNELLSNQRTLMHEMQFSEAARARLPALFTAMVREMSTHPIGDQESVVKTPCSTSSVVVAKAKATPRSRKAATPAAAAVAPQQQQPQLQLQLQGIGMLAQVWEEKESLLLLAASARSLPRCFDHKSSSTHFIAERRREVLRSSVAANLQEDSLDLASGLTHGVSWRTVEIGIRCAMEGIAGHDKLRSSGACLRRANEMLTERPMIPPAGTRWRGSMEGMAGEKQRQVGTPLDVRIVRDHSAAQLSDTTPTAVEQALTDVDDRTLEKSLHGQEDALELFHYRRGLTTPTFAAFYPTKSVPSALVRRRRQAGESAGRSVGQVHWRLPKVRKCIQKASTANSILSPPPHGRRRRRRPCSIAIRSSVSRVATPVSFSEALKAWDEYIATVSHQNSCRWLSNAVTSMGVARRRRATECREMRVFQWEAPPLGSPASPLALRNAHANALLALQRYAAASTKGAPVKQLSSCIGPEAMKLLTYAAKRMKEQMPDNGSGIHVAPTKQPIPENYRRTKVTMLPMATSRPSGPHMIGQAPSHQFTPVQRQQHQAGGFVMGKATPSGAYQRVAATASPQQQQQQQPQHLAQLLQLRNAAAAAGVVTQDGGTGQQQPMQQYIMPKRGQMQPTIGLQNQQQQLKVDLGGGKAPSPAAQRFPGQGLGTVATGAMPKMPQATVQNLLQSMLAQQQAQQQQAASPSTQSTVAGQQAGNQNAAAAAAAALGRANLGNLHQLYQRLLTQFTHGATGPMRRPGGMTPTGPSPSSPGSASAAAAAGGVPSGTTSMPAIQNMLQNIFANNRSQYSTAATPKAPGVRAQQGPSTTTTASLQQHQQQQRSPYQQFYYGNAVSGGTSILPKAVPSKASAPPAPRPPPTTTTAAAHENPNAPSGSGL